MGSHNVCTHWMYQYYILYLTWWWLNELKHVAEFLRLITNICCVYWLNKLLYNCCYAFSLRENVSQKRRTVKHISQIMWVFNNSGKYDKQTDDFRKKMMRKIFGPTRLDDGYWRVKTNQEINDILKGRNIIGFIKNKD